MERGSFIFYRSFASIQSLKLKERDWLIWSLVNYSLDGVEPDWDKAPNKAILQVLWASFTPIIDANTRRFLAGKMGGAPVGSNNNPNGRRGNQELTKNQPGTNQELTKNQPYINVNINKNANTEEDKIDANASSSGEPEGRGFFSPDEKSQKITATQFVEVWNRIIREAGVAIKPIDARALGDKPRDKIQIRIREMSRLGPPLEILEQVMKKACSSMFCCGQSKGGWLMTFDWFIRNGDNWRKIYQGNYDDKVSNGTQGGYTPLHVTATKWEDFEGDF